MVHCTRCEAKGEGNAVEWESLGAPLKVSEGWSRRSRREEEMCFGAEGCFRPWFGRAAGMVLGLFIVFIGLLGFIGSYFHVDVWWLVLVAIGVIIIVGGYTAYSRQTQ